MHDPRVRERSAAGKWRLARRAPVAGLTVVLEAGVAGLYGVVVDQKGKPFAEAKVHARTVSHRQQGTTTSDGRGNFAFEWINPDVYLVWAEAGKARSRVETVVLLKGRKEKVELVLGYRAEDEGGG